MNHGQRAQRVLYYITLATFAVSAVILAARLIVALVSDTEEQLLYSGYLLSLLQCALGVFAVFIPRLLHIKYGFSFPNWMMILYFIFLYCAIFLGEVRNYYINVPLWDDILHGFSGVMAGFFAFMLISVAMQRAGRDRMLLPPLLTALFAFVFSVAVGALWEIYEFTLDAFLELNMQKYRENDGTMLIGREAVSDTMKDIVIDTVGALFAATAGYISMKKRKPSDTEKRNKILKGSKDQKDELEG